jgi:hypothetical protein
VRLKQFTRVLPRMRSRHGAKRRVEAAAEHNMTGGSAMLPDELLLRVLEHVMLRGDGRKGGVALCGW